MQKIYYERKVTLKMGKIVTFSTARESVAHKIYMYFVFTIAMAWSQIAFNSFISSFFDPPHKKLILYTSEICFMTIVLTANNLRDLVDGQTLKKGKLLFDFLFTSNILNAVFSLVFSVGFSFMESSNSGYQPSQKQFLFVIITYLAAASMGLAVQIGGGIDRYKINHTNRR